MKKFSWKKLMSLVLVFALIIGGINLGARKVSAEEESDLISSVEGKKAVVDGREIPTVYYTFLRDTVDDVIKAKINVVLLIDNSVSMQGARLSNAKTAAQYFVQGMFDNKNLEPTFYLVTFAGSAQTISLEGLDCEGIKKKIADIGNSSGTNIKAGIDEALKHVNSTEKDTTYMLILSDGEANRPNGWGVDTTAVTIEALKSAKNSVNTLYAIRIGDNQAKTIGEVVDSSNIIDVNDASGIGAGLQAISSKIQKEAVLANVIAEKGKYVTFKNATNADGTENNKVTPGKYTFKDETEEKDVIIWNITDPEGAEVKQAINSPMINFEINKTPEELYNLYMSGEDTENITIERVADSNLIKIGIKLTGKTVLAYTQKINDETTEKVVDVANFLDLLAYEQTEVPYSVEYVYYVDNEKYVIDSYEGQALDGSEISIPKLTDEQFAAKELTPANFIYSENNDFNPPVGVDNHNFTIVLQKLSTVRFIDEFQALEDEGELPVTVQEGTEAVGTQLVFPVDPRPDYTENNETYKFAGWAMKVAVGGAIAIDEEGNVVDEAPVSEVLLLVKPEDFTTYGISDLTFYAKYVKDIPEPEVEYSVKFLNNDGTEILENVGSLGDTIAVPEYRVAFDYAGIKAAYTTYTFYGWADYDASKTAYTLADADNTVVTEVIPEFGRTYIAVYKSEYNPPKDDPTPSPYVPPIIFVTPTPSPVPTEAPTPVPTEVPTEEPTPTPEPVVEVEEPETPEGDVEIDEIETPEGAPEEELEVEPIDTPQGDLPKTGVLPTYAFIGIGAACVLFGSILVIKRRKEEN
jgi:LPXTG-motif cell wall-anchored protein